MTVGLVHYDADDYTSNDELDLIQEERLSVTDRKKLEQTITVLDTVLEMFSGDDYDRLVEAVDIIESKIASC